MIIVTDIAVRLALLPPRAVHAREASPAMIVNKRTMGPARMTLNPTLAAVGELESAKIPVISTENAVITATTTEAVENTASKIRCLLNRCTFTCVCILAPF